VVYDKPMSSRPNKNLFLINRDLQLKYTYAAVVVGFVSTLVTVIVLLYPLFVFQILKIPKFLPLPVFAAMIAAVLMNIVLVGMLGIYVTHRVAGPVFHLVKCFRRIELGRLKSHLRLREGDDLKYVMRNFNAMVDELLRTSKEDLDLLQQAQSGNSEKLAELKLRLEKRLEND
jgi:nitrate/nitrite-specific signal transduction histidine kinase